MTSEFTAYYDMANSFVRLAQCGDTMTGTMLRHHGHVIARILDDKNMQLTTVKDLPTPTHGLRGVVAHVAKRYGMLVIDKDLSREAALL